MAIKQPKVKVEPQEVGCTHQQAIVNRWQNGQSLDALDNIAEEVPVALVYNGISHVVMMASPTQLEDFALGFSLSEGIIEKQAEVYSIELDKPQRGLSAGIEIKIEISSQRAAQLKQRRRNLMGRTGCGLCGAESLQQAIRPVTSVEAQPLPPPEVIQKALSQLSDHQPLQNLTGAFHGAAWCNAAGEIQLIREDVGRHNALDKLIGALNRAATDTAEGFVLISSRASYEMVHKACSSGIRTLVAVSAPTGLAVELAQQAGLNLIGFARLGKHIVYNPSAKREKS